MLLKNVESSVPEDARLTNEFWRKHNVSDSEKKESPAVRRGFRQLIIGGPDRDYLPPKPLLLPTPLQKSHPGTAKFPTLNPQLPKKMSRKSSLSEKMCL